MTTVRRPAHLLAIATIAMLGGTACPRPPAEQKPVPPPPPRPPAPPPSEPVEASAPARPPPFLEEIRKTHCCRANYYSLPSKHDSNCPTRRPEKGMREAARRRRQLERGTLKVGR